MATAKGKGSAGRKSLEGADISGRCRVCKKLVLKGQASSRGATYVLYLKLDLTSIAQGEVVPLVSETGVNLKDAYVFRLDKSGTASALSNTAVAAAKNLGIPLSLSNNISSQQNLPEIYARNDGCIELATSTEMAFYMVALNVQVKLLSQPPYMPFVVRLPKPFCLNNYLRFTVDESIAGAQGMQQVAVEVDPPILSRRQSSARSSYASEIGTSDDGDMTILEPPSDDSDTENDGATIQGPFKSCDAVVLRFASDQAGSHVLNDTGLILPCALRAEAATSFVEYSPLVHSDDRSKQNANAVSFHATIELTKPFYAGLEHEVFLYLQLCSVGSTITWLPEAVDASHGILSWTMGGVPSDVTDDDRSPVASLGRAVDNLVWPDLSASESVDEEDLFKVTPLSGLDHAGLDFSLDTGAPSAGQQSRFSLSTPAVEGKADSASNRPLVTPNVLIVGFSLLPLLQSTDPVVISISGLVEADRSKDRIYPGLHIASVQNHAPSRVEIHNHLQVHPNESIVQAAEPTVQTAMLPPAEPIADVVLQQVLAAMRTRETEQRQSPSTSRTSILFRVSHLLWTLLLTYMMFSLFTASQTANQALHVKLDHLSRLVEQHMVASASQNINSDSLGLSTGKDHEAEVWLTANDAVTAYLDPLRVSLPSPAITSTDMRSTLDTISVAESFLAMVTETVSLPFSFLRQLLFILFRI